MTAVYVFGDDTVEGMSMSEHFCISSNFPALSGRSTKCLAKIGIKAGMSRKFEVKGHRLTATTVYLFMVVAAFVRFLSAQVTAVRYSATIEDNDDSTIMSVHMA
jgi:hypothetical protein